MTEKSLFDLKNGVADCPYPIVSSVPVCCLQEIAQDAYCLCQLVHKEIVISPQSLNGRLGFAQSQCERLFVRSTAYAIYDAGKR